MLAGSEYTVKPKYLVQIKTIDKNRRQLLNTTTDTGWFVDHFMCKKRMKSYLILLLNPSRGFVCVEMSRDSTDVRTAPPCGLFASCICSLAEGCNVALQESFHTIRQMKISHSYFYDHFQDLLSCSWQNTTLNTVSTL